MTEAHPQESPTVTRSGRDGQGMTSSLYRKHRPQTFDPDELVGQDPIVTTLKNAVALDRIAHAYLFCGPRGTGKTTTARLLAKAANCLDPDVARRPCNECDACKAITSGASIDVIEIDAASNRGIDDIRDLRERVKFSPASLRLKFYIIDEAHQITGAAANAFLKTLEEPPSHTRFVLATTDPEQLLPTIVSRCQRFDFRKIDTQIMVDRLRTVADQEQIAADQDALTLIAQHSSGSLRDALGLLDQLSLYDAPDSETGDRRIGADDVRLMLGVSHDRLLVELAEAIANSDAAAALTLAADALGSGSDPRQLTRQFVDLLRAVLYQLAGSTTSAGQEIDQLAERMTLEQTARYANTFGDIDFRSKVFVAPQLPLELAIVESIISNQSPPAQLTPEAPSKRPAEKQEPEPLPASRQASQPSPTRQSLADRVKSRPESEPDRRSAEKPPAPEETAPQIKETSPTAEVTASGELTIDTVQDRWDEIRSMVKARSRRVEALLVSADPSSLNHDLLKLSAAYPFHRDKLNEASVSSLIESVLEEVTGVRIRLQTELAGSEPPRPRPKSTTGVQPEPDAVPVDPKMGISISEQDRKRLTAAQNIFDAEPIDD